MKKVLLLAGMLPIVAFGQFRDHCPNFTINKQKSGIHYELPKYKPKRMPRNGLTVFMGAYGGLSNSSWGGGVSGRVQMVEYGVSAGWDVRTVNPQLFKKPGEPTTQLPYTAAFGATLGKSFILGGKTNIRGLVDTGLGYGQSAHTNTPNKIPVFGYGIVSYRVIRDFWLSGSIHVTDFKSTPEFRIGIATLVW
jgi:hypothetical protein